MSREFHLRLAHTARNAEFPRMLESLWTIDIGRHLLAVAARTRPGRRRTPRSTARSPQAVEAGDGDRAAELMARHLASTHEYWIKVCKQALSA